MYLYIKFIYIYIQINKLSLKKIEMMIYSYKHSINQRKKILFNPEKKSHMVFIPRIQPHPKKNILN